MNNQNIYDLYNYTVVRDTPTYTLYFSDVSSSPGFLILEPKIPGNKKMWVMKALKYMKMFAQQINVQNTDTEEQDVNKQTWQSNSFNYKDGSVRIDPDLVRVEISQSHPNRLEVISDMLKLYTANNSEIEPVSVINNTGSGSVIVISR